MRLLPALALALLLFPSSLDAADTPEEVIAAGIKAIGGEEVLKKFPASTWTEKGNYYGMGSELPFTGTYAAEFPDRFRMEIENFFTSCIDGETGWVSQGGTVMDMDADQLKTQVQSQKCGWVASLRPFLEEDHGFELELLGESTINDTEVVGVRTKKEGFQNVELYFDKATHLLKSARYKTFAPELGGLVDSQAFYLDYHEVQGMQVPMSLTVERGGEKFLDVQHSDMKLSEKLDDEVFARPE